MLSVIAFSFKTATCSNWICKYTYLLTFSYPLQPIDSATEIYKKELTSYKAF